MNSTPYFDLVKKLEKEHGNDIHGSKLGSTCADCHSPKDMSLRVTRPAFINAMVARGYEADPEHGIKASRQQMRSFVCNQCHVEYYFQGKDKLLTFPWTKWTKDQPLRIEMIEKYYDENKKDFPADWTHKDTKAPMLKMQHPETELYSSGVHARSNVACVDCHMPYKRSGSQKVTDHNLQSPLANINNACRSCHPQSEEMLKAKVNFIQITTANALRASENSILALITDVKAARAALAKNPKFAAIADKTEQDKQISAVLAKALDDHRRAQMRWDFIFSENSTGFHSPQEAIRVLSQSTEFARLGQLEVQKAVKPFGISITPTVAATFPKAPAPINPNSLVGAKPPMELMKLDMSYNFYNQAK